MNSVNVARLTEGMSLGQIYLEMRKLGDFRSPPSQNHTMENGVEVVYVKKSGPQDRLKRLIMSQDMKVNEARPLANLILNACKKIGVDVSDSGYQNIREVLINGNGDFHLEMQNLVLKEVTIKFSRSHGF
jgi:hypothetical protein